MIFDIEERKLYIGDFRADYISFGKGTKSLVMIHGLNTRGIRGSGRMLAYMYRIFAKEYRVHIFDRREDVPKGITVREFASDIAAGMEALSIVNADVFGVSQGGMIAQYLAIDRPELVNKLVLAVTLSKNNDTVVSVVRHWVETVERGDMSRLIADMADKMYSEKYLKRYRMLLPLLSVLQKPKDKRRFISLAESCLTCKAYEELDKIKCPVLVIGGGKDRVVGAEAAGEIAEKLTCKIYIYKDLGHAAYEEAKDFNQRVYDFLSE